MKKASNITPNLRLKAAREGRGWSQKYVADQIDADHYYLSRWEHGTAFPSPHYRSKLCVLFGADARELGLLPDAGRNALHPYGDDGAADNSVVGAAAKALDKHAQEILDPAIPTPLLHVEDIVGRDDLLTSLRERLSIGKGLVLTALNGLPGVGKTTLAVALVHDEEVRTHFPNGLLWAGLGPRPNVLGHLSRWGTLLGISAQESAGLLSVEAWIRAIHAIVAGRKMLLVIDDAWDIDDALSFKIGGPHCAYLVTTRYPHLALQFSADGTTMVEELSEEQGIHLLTHLAPAIADSDPVVVRELVRAVGGLPLALTLIGKYLRTQMYSGQPRRVRAAIERLRNVEERLRLSEPRALLEHASSLAPDTPISLHAIIEVSEQPLNERARDALRALSVFPSKPNSFSEEAALAITAVPTEVLDELTDVGLLEGRGPGRYTLHQIIADYAMTHLSDTGAYHRLVRYFSDFVKEHEMDYHLLELEMHNIFAALEAAARYQLHTQFVYCTHDFTHFLEARGLNAQAEEYLKRAEQAALAAHDLAGLASTYRKLGRIVGKRGEHAQEESYLKQALAIARQINHREQMCITLKNLGAMAGERGDYTQAKAYLLEGLALAREIDYREQIGVLLLNLGQVASERGAFEQAEKCLLEGLMFAREVGYPEQISLLLSNLGVLEGRREHYAQAETYLQEGLVLARQIGYKERIGLLLVNLGWIVSAMGRHEQADSCMQEALEVARQSGNRWLISGILGEQGESYLTRQLFDKASAAFQEMLTIETGGANQKAIGEALYGLARVAEAQGDMVEARRLGEESAGILEKTGHLTAPEVKQWLAQHVPNAP